MHLALKIMCNGFVMRLQEVYNRQDKRAGAACHRKLSVNNWKSAYIMKKQ